MSSAVKGEVMNHENSGRLSGISQQHIKLGAIGIDFIHENAEGTRTLLVTFPGWGGWIAGGVLLARGSGDLQALQDDSVDVARPPQKLPRADLG